MESVVYIGIAFLLGSFPTAYLIGKYFVGVDIRDLGNSNPGAINTYRSLGKRMGMVVLLIDAGKGALAIYVGGLLGVAEIILFIAAFAASMGHIFSPFLGFRGGKGAATVLGISAAMLWQITAVTLLLGIILFLLTKHMVWSVTGMFVILNALTIASQPIGPIVLCLTLSFLIAITHLVRQRPQLIPALRERDWRRFMNQD